MYTSNSYLYFYRVSGKGIAIVRVGLSVRFHSYLLNRLTVKLKLLCVLVMTVARLGLKVLKLKG